MTDATAVHEPVHSEPTRRARWASVVIITALAALGSLVVALPAMA